MAYQIAAMIIGLLLISGASLWGVNGLHHDYGSAIAGYEELRRVYEIGSHITTARTLLRLQQPEEREAIGQIQAAASAMELSPSPATKSSDPADEVASRQSARETIATALKDAQTQLWNSIASSDHASAAAALAPLDRSLSQVSNLATEVRKAVQRKQHAANRKLRTTLLALSILSAAVIAAAVGVGILHYRSVVNPLKRLEAGVRHIAEGKLNERVPPLGFAEFVSLAANLNRMAEELEGLYRELEAKVAAKSKELVRSERLASVGYLAAGVAHEINNPIGIIAGYAEFCLQQLAKQNGKDAVAEAEKSLRVINDEAFRCKQIVQKLLTLARPGEESRGNISLGQVASDVVSIVTGLRQFQDRRIDLRVHEADDLRVVASEGEMKQVVLNLTLNALEAVDGTGAPVSIEVRRSGDVVELCVTDSGKGMTSEVLERAFEPFFTAKRGSARPGTGLGLSISHAIVDSHGGRIAAQSAGPGKGSSFTVQLPAANGGPS